MQMEHCIPQGIVRCIFVVFNSVLVTSFRCCYATGNVNVIYTVENRG